MQTSDGCYWAKTPKSSKKHDVQLSSEAISTFHVVNALIGSAMLCHANIYRQCYCMVSSAVVGMVCHSFITMFHSSTLHRHILQSAPKHSQATTHTTADLNIGTV